MSITQFSDAYEYSLAEIDDIRLIQLDVANPALYLYRLFSYMQNAIARVTNPKGIQERIGNYTEPILKQSTHTGDGTTTVFTVGENADCVTVSDKDGEIIATIIPSESSSANGITYNAENGTITFDVAPAQGYVFNADLYTDGYFNVELNIYEMNILGIAFRYVWFSKIANTFLRTTPKIKDKNFNMDSSWGVEQADTAKLRAMKTDLVDAMADYERYLAYYSTVPNTWQLINQASIQNLVRRAAGGN